MNYTLHKLQEGFILTSDEKPKNGDIVISKINYRKFLFEKGDIIDDISHKVIAQQDQIDFSALLEEEQKEIGWFDVEKLYPIKSIERHSPFTATNNQLRQEGFQKAQELLSDRKFTKGEMKLAFLETDTNRSFEEFIRSLSQTSWKIEIEIVGSCICYGLGSIGCNYENNRNSIVSKMQKCEKKYEPKLTNGKIKILKLL